MTVDGELRGRVALVTGAGRNIGRAIALALAAAGAAVAINGRRDQRAVDAVAGEVAALGGEALPMLADVSDQAAVERLIAATIAHF
jgi:3-oxoacyl-[acyl-carrier protein] reductase